MLRPWSAILWEKLKTPKSQSTKFKIQSITTIYNTYVLQENEDRFYRHNRKLFRK